MMLKQVRFSLKRLASTVRYCSLTLFSIAVLSLTGHATAEGIKVAFIGDQGTDKNAQAVLSLVANEGTELLLIQGDLGYLKGSASAWESNLDTALGRNFPVLTVVGNHENFEWPLYQRLIQRRIDRIEALNCTGNTGVKATCRFGNLEIVHVAPGIYEVDGVAANDDYAGYIRDAFNQPSANWRICGWHKNQNKLQTGGKRDRTGWAVYDACLDAGAMIALAHEHAYSRTYLLSNFENQRVVHTGTELTLKPGQSFAFVSGLGGKSVRSQMRGGDWWASIYTATQGATHGALFCEFKTATADCYFKAIDGAVPDRFTLKLPAAENSAESEAKDTPEATDELTLANAPDAVDLPDTMQAPSASQKPEPNDDADLSSLQAPPAVDTPEGAAKPEKEPMRLDDAMLADDALPPPAPISPSIPSVPATDSIGETMQYNSLSDAQTATEARQTGGSLSIIVLALLLILPSVRCCPKMFIQQGFYYPALGRQHHEHQVSTW